jgi:hypothetical protein
MVKAGCVETSPVGTRIRCELLGLAAQAANRVTLGFSTLLLTGEVHAQGVRWRGGGGWGAGGQYARLYDTNTVETISGKVTAVETTTPFKGMGQGVRLMLETDKETISVHLGPV